MVIELHTLPYLDLIFNSKRILSQFIMSDSIRLQTRILLYKCRSWSVVYKIRWSKFDENHYLHYMFLKFDSHALLIRWWVTWGFSRVRVKKDVETPSTHQCRTFFVCVELPLITVNVKTFYTNTRKIRIEGKFVCLETKREFLTKYLRYIITTNI